MFKQKSLQLVYLLYLLLWFIGAPWQSTIVSTVFRKLGITGKTREKNYVLINWQFVISLIKIHWKTLWNSTPKYFSFCVIFFCHANPEIQSNFLWFNDSKISSYKASNIEDCFVENLKTLFHALLEEIDFRNHFLIKFDLRFLHSIFHFFFVVFLRIFF